MTSRPNTQVPAGIGFVAVLVALGGAPAAVAQVPGAGVLAPRQIAALKARPCPAGLVATTDAEIRSMGIPPEQFWAGVAGMDQMRNSPQYRAQFDAALAQARVQVSSSGGKLTELDQTAAALRDDPALTLRCHPKGASQLQGMGAPGGGMPGIPGIPGMGGMPGVPGADMMKATLTQSLTGSMAKLGPAGLLAGAAAPIAVPLASKALGGLFNKKPKTPEQLANDLGKNGELAIDGLKFAAGEASPAGSDLETRVAALASALGTLEGGFLLYIQPEADKGGEPDVKLARQRCEKVQAMLVAAGVPGDRLEVISERPEYAKFAATAKPGNARAYLVRKRAADGTPPARTETHRD